MIIIDIDVVDYIIINGADICRYIGDGAIRHVSWTPIFSFIVEINQVDLDFINRLDSWLLFTIDCSFHEIDKKINIFFDRLLGFGASSTATIRALV